MTLQSSQLVRLPPVAPGDGNEPVGLLRLGDVARDATLARTNDALAGLEDAVWSRWTLYESCLDSCGGALDFFNVDWEILTAIVMDG